MVAVRQTAYKLWISDLVKGEYYRELREWEPNYVLTRGLKVSRVNIVANVVDKYLNSNYAYLDLDDGSSKIRVKGWGEDINLIKEVRLGALILAIGRVREFNGEIYLIPEIIKELQNLDWAKLRRLELAKLYGDALKNDEIAEEKLKVEEVLEDVTQTARKKIFGIIGGIDEITYDELVSKTELDKKEVERIVKELIKEGELYMPRPNYLRCI